MTVTVVGVLLLLSPWVLDGGSNVGDPGHAPAGLDELPAELWLVLVVIALLWTVGGLAFIWRRR